MIRRYERWLSGHLGWEGEFDQDLYELLSISQGWSSSVDFKNPSSSLLFHNFRFFPNSCRRERRDAPGDFWAGIM